MLSRETQKQGLEQGTGQGFESREDLVAAGFLSAAMGSFGLTSLADVSRFQIRLIW